MTPFATRIFASVKSSSFWVAQGKAMSHLIFHISLGDALKIVVLSKVRYSPVSYTHLILLELGMIVRV